jgi:methionyl-tRNA synthetase
VSDPFYITTAIFYPNGRPHVGHAYEAILTDCAARFQALMGRDVRMVSGTDEHGLKMAQTAKREGLSPQGLADRNAPYFQDMLARFGCRVDDFVRTTEDRHRLASEAVWQRMAARGDIYLGRYEGWYSVRDEAFYDDSEVTAGEGGIKLSPQGTPVEWTVEESFFFRLSAYEKQLIDLLESDTLLITPTSRKNEVLGFLKGGLKDLSISRKSFDWGFPVPAAPDHVMYVWVDALTSYLTGAGFPKNPRWWPAHVHMIGKDIVRFHAVYWPAFLLSAGLPLPRQLAVHGFLFNRGEKMSKSSGNVIDPIALVDHYGTDALRYFFLREVSFGQDGSYSHEAIVNRVNAELANSFGNLVQRTLAFIAKNLEGRLPAPGGDDAWRTETTAIRVEFIEAMAAFDFSGALEVWIGAIYRCNQYIDQQAPWTLRKTDPARMEAVLAELVAAIHDLALLVQPVIPDTAAKVLDMLQVPADWRSYSVLDDPRRYRALVDAGVVISPPSPICARLEAPAEPDA